VPCVNRRYWPEWLFIHISGWNFKEWNGLFLYHIQFF
jgi:hypothetical protein